MSRFPLRALLGGLFVAVTSALAGLLLGGVRGLIVGWLAGLGVALLPLATRVAVAWLRRPAQAAVHAASVLAALVTAGADGLLRSVTLILGPVAAVVRIPIWILGVAGLFAGDLLVYAAGRLASVMNTWLGLANIAAVLLIAGEAAGLPIPPFVWIIAFVLLLLVLLVEQYEAASGPSSTTR